MFPHPVVAFLAYLEAPNSILAKNQKNKSVHFYIISRFSVFSRVFCIRLFAALENRSVMPDHGQAMA